MMVFEGWKRTAERLKGDIYALGLAVRDRRTPWPAKLLIAVIIAYAVSPIDPIPDVIPGLGYLDELVVLPVGVWAAIKLIPDEVMMECRARATEELDIGRIRWLIAAFVVGLWLLIGVLALGFITSQL